LAYVVGIIAQTSGIVKGLRRKREKNADRV
jgi:hypothetical protein